MKIVKINVYKFSELSKESKDKAVEKLGDINMYFGWFDYFIDDAKNVGLDITDFDVDHGTIDGKFIDGPEPTADKIIKNHGGKCDTRITSVNYLNARIKILEEWGRDENGGFINESKLDDKLDLLDIDFEHDILEDYLINLRGECKYLSSREAIIQTIEANDYEFTNDGKIYR